LTVALNQSSNIEAGLAFQRYNRFLDVTYAQFNYGLNDWLNNPLYTNKYDFDEDILGVYANLNTSFWGITSSLGLRMEYTDRKLQRKKSDERYDYNKTNFFPGISLSKSLNDNHSLKLSLSNRINRPDEYMMNPFPEFEDNYFYSEGNPYLIPEIVRNAELGHQYSKKGFIVSSTLYYRRTEDKLEQKLTIREEDNKINTIFHNASEDRSIGAELMVNTNPISWWSMNASANAYHYKVKADIEGAKTIRKNYSWNTQMVNSLNINRETTFQIIGYYQNRTVRSQGELSSIFFVDIALQRKLFNGRLSVNLQLKDIFQTSDVELFTETGNMKLLGDFNRESPIFRINLSYTLSNYKKKTKDVQTEFDM
jgi:outer membrane receptor protein involved in Fe transport